MLVVDGIEVALHTRTFEREQTFQEWQHKAGGHQPGALRDRAIAVPEVLQMLQWHLLRNPGGDRVMAQVVAVVPVHGLDAALAHRRQFCEVVKPLPCTGASVRIADGPLTVADSAVSFTTVAGQHAGSTVNARCDSQRRARD